MFIYFGFKTEYKLHLYTSDVLACAFSKCLLELELGVDSRQ